MSNKIIEKLKNQQGSSLAFVLIIGMIIMIMVASLLAVANSDFTFTQETVESRQAYIDAKSVIEFGKIEINERMAELELMDQQLKKLYSELEAMETNNPLIVTKKTEIQTKIADINTYVSNDLIAPYYIGGDENNISKTLKTLEAIDDQVTAVGVLKVVSENSGNETKKYTFKIETQNLRRKLDFEAPFNYGVVTTSTPGTGTSPPIPDLTEFIDSEIFINKNSKLECKITGEGYGIGDKKEDNQGLLEIIPNMQHFNEVNINLTKFEFLGQRKLEIAANQIAVSVLMPVVWKPSYSFGLKEGEVFKTQTLYFDKGYKPDAGGYHDSTNILKAKNIVINENLILLDNSTLDIDCDNLWITGNVDLSMQTSVNKIKAKNIVINGNLNLSHSTKLTIDCPNICLGSFTSGTTTPELVMNNVKYFKAGAMNINDKMKLIIVGAAGSSSNQVEVGTFESTSGGQKINITGLYSFNCLGNFTQNCSEGGFVNIQSKIIKIGGDLTISDIGDANSRFLTNYFLCGGNTNFTRIKDGFFIGDSGVATSCVKFAGAYSQVESQIKLYGNQIISFNGNVQMGTSGGNRSFRLQLQSDNIYFQGSQIVANSGVNQPNRIICAGFSNPQSTKVYLQNGATNSSVAAGKYIGYSTNELSDITLVPGDFSLISFPDPPVADGGSTGGGTGSGTGGSGGGSGTSGETTTTISIEKLPTRYY